MKKYLNYLIWYIIYFGIFMTRSKSMHKNKAYIHQYDIKYNFVYQWLHMEYKWWTFPTLIMDSQQLYRIPDAYKKIADTYCPGLVIICYISGDQREVSGVTALALGPMNAGGLIASNYRSKKLSYFHCHLIHSHSYCTFLYSHVFI